MRITKNDHEFVTTNDPWFGWFWATVNDGTWEPETFRIFDRFLAKNTTFIDAGAWIGPTVLYASRLCNRCFALEPSPMSYRELVNNLEANCSYNVLALQEALWEYDGFLTLGNDGGSTGGSSTRVDSNKNNFQVP